MNKLKVLSLFSGIGAFEKALENISADVELVGFSEIDKYAIKSYCAIHNVDGLLNYGDVSKINKVDLPDFDLLVGGSPCQAFSVAGHRKGFEDTRGTLFFQYVETLKHKQPKYFVYENVKGLINHDKGNTLNVIAQSFSDVGYRIDIELLNSKYFNVPQNRERIYIIGIKDDLIENEEWAIDSKRNDVMMNGKRRLKELNIKSFNFTYPKQKSVNLRLRDILEENVDEKFYISEEKAVKLINQLEENNKYFTDKTCIDPIQSGRGELRVYEDISPTLNSRDYKEPRMIIDQSQIFAERGRLIDGDYKVNREFRKDDLSNTLGSNTGLNMLLEPTLKEVGKLEIKGNDSIKRVYDSEGLSPTLTTMEGGNREPKIVEPQINIVAHDKIAGQKGFVYNVDGISSSLMATDYKDPKRILLNEAHNKRDVHMKGVELIGNLNPSGNGMNGSVYDSEGLSPTITTNKDEGLKISLSEVRPVLTPEREEKRQMGRRFKENDEPAFTVNTIDQHGLAIGNYPKYRIRKLTPLECFKLQAFSKEDYQRCVDAGISNSQLYKQAGNSITVTVLEGIFKELFDTYL